MRKQLPQSKSKYFLLGKLAPIIAIVEDQKFLEELQYLEHTLDNKKAVNARKRLKNLTILVDDLYKELFNISRTYYKRDYNEKVKSQGI